MYSFVIASKLNNAEFLDHALVIIIKISHKSFYLEQVKTDYSFTWNAKVHMKCKSVVEIK